MRNPLNLSRCFMLLLSAVAGAAHAEIEASLDLRLVDSDGRKSFVDGGWGKLRYPANDDGLNLGRARFAWRGSPGGDWHANVDLSAWSLDEHNALGVTEAWMEWRPVPQSAWRSNLKIGAFYAPISLENRAPGWTNPYTISNSALNTWVGEELRTIGVGYSLEHLGEGSGSAFDFGVNVAVFGWNDPAGVVLALRGFAMHDRQTSIFGHLGTYAYGGRDQRVEFAEIDHRAGYHVGGYVKHDSGFELSGLHYDNRADPSVYLESIDDYAWNTRFDTLGVRYDSPRGTTLIAQWMHGGTAAGPDYANRWKFDTEFVLLSQAVGKHRFAVRYDDFSTYQLASAFPGALSVDEGHALTANWTWQVRNHVEIAVEWLDIHSDYSARVALGELPRADEHLLQMALRFYL
ncbi:MAG: hypothetical protein ABI616_03220 [Pseudomonadota bacterium]